MAYNKTVHKTVYCGAGTESYRKGVVYFEEHNGGGCPLTAQGCADLKGLAPFYF